MLAIAIALGMFAAPFLLWAAGLHTLAIFVGIFVALSTPSIIYMFYLSIKHREWPKIVGGPSIMWAGKHYGLGGRRV